MKMKYIIVRVIKNDNGYSYEDGWSAYHDLNQQYNTLMEYQRMYPTFQFEIREAL